MENDASVTPPLDLNRADAAALTTLPGIGPGLAARIVRYREEVHPFEETEEITAVPGISETMYHQFADRVTVSSTVDGLSSSAPAADTQDEKPEPAPIVPANPSNQPENRIEASLAQPTPQLQSESSPPSQSEALPDVQSAGPSASAGTTGTSETKPPPQDEKSVPVPPPVIGFAFWWRSCLLMLISIVGGAVLALLLLQRINGTLEISTHPEVIRLNQELTALQREDERLREEISVLRSRLNQIEAMSGRLQQAETDIETLNRALTTLDEQLASVEQNTDQIQESIEQIQSSTNRFDNFLEGLRDLLLAPEGTPGPMATATPSLVPTDIEPAEATPVETNAATATRTPRPTRTPTATPTVTATPLSAAPRATPDRSVSSAGPASNQ
jgi:competence ComEA-like helix-hairpin-helix protein